MKPLLLPLLILASLAAARAHEHIEVGQNPADASQLFLDGPAYQLALHVPRGEPFSGYLPDFPGGCFAVELTFTTEVNALDFAAGSLARVELVAVIGPPGAGFSFWEVGAAAATWTRPTGWTAGGADRPSLQVYEDLTGYGHVHGRAFSVDRAGTYLISFRAVDDASPPKSASPIKTITFVAQEPPALSLAMIPAAARVSFHSRLILSYDLQVCEDLNRGQWTTIASWIDGAASLRTLDDPVGTRANAFYRLVEYR
ncbi:MAG: hypothetical protein ACOYOL_05250 [Chthoniobacterales bacterium]